MLRSHATAHGLAEPRAVDNRPARATAAAGCFAFLFQSVSDGVGVDLGASPRWNSRPRLRGPAYAGPQPVTSAMLPAA